MRPDGCRKVLLNQYSWVQIYAITLSLILGLVYIFVHTLINLISVGIFSAGNSS